MKETICLVIGAIGAGIASLFGGWDSALVTLIIFMGVDFATDLITGATLRTPVMPKACM